MKDRFAAMPVFSRSAWAGFANLIFPAGSCAPAGLGTRDSMAQPRTAARASLRAWVLNELPFGNRAVSGCEIPGFAPPPHDGFAFFEERAPPVTYMIGTTERGVQMPRARWTNVEARRRASHTPRATRGPCARRRSAGAARAGGPARDPERPGR